MAATDASVKEDRMGGSWIIGNKENKCLLSNRLHHKDWRENTSGAAEVIVLLELITILERKGRNVNSGKIVIGVDYKRAHKKILSDIRKSNEHAKESGAEIAMIKQLLKKMQFDVEIKLMRGHKKGVIRYQNEPVKWLIRKCDSEAEKAREEGIKK